MAESTSLLLLKASLRDICRTFCHGAVFRRIAADSVYIYGRRRAVFMTTDNESTRTDSGPPISFVALIPRPTFNITTADT